MLFISQKYYKLIGIDSLRQKNMAIPQKNNSTAKSKKDDDTTMFLLLKSNKRLF